MFLGQSYAKGLALLTAGAGAMSYTEGVRIPGGNNTRTLNAIMRHDNNAQYCAKVKQRTGQNDNQNASRKKYDSFASEMSKCGKDYQINKQYISVYNIYED